MFRSLDSKNTGNGSNSNETAYQSCLATWVSVKEIFFSTPGNGRIRDFLKKSTPFSSSYNSWDITTFDNGPVLSRTMTLLQISRQSKNFYFFFLFYFISIAALARLAISKAMRKMESLSCIRFKLRTNEPYFVRFIRGVG